MKGIRGPRIPGKRVAETKKQKEKKKRKDWKKDLEVSIPKDKWESLGTVYLPLDSKS